MRKILLAVAVVVMAFSAIAYTMSFDAGDGSGSMGSITSQKGGGSACDECSDSPGDEYYFVFPSCRFTRPGYSFGGWLVYDPCVDWGYDYYYTSRYWNGRAYYGPFDVGDIYWAYCSVRVIPYWVKKATYTVRLHRNNSYNDGATANRTMAVGSYVSLPTISSLGWTRSGYEFVGWGTFQSDTSYDYWDGQSVYNLRSYDGEIVDLYAIWRENASYTVRLHRNNSPNDGATASRKCIMGVGRYLPTVSELGWSRTGYTFSGWNTYSDASSALYSNGAWIYDLASWDGETVDLYAVWSENASYTVRLHRNNSNADGATAARKFVVDVGRYLPTISELGWSKPGYTFSGWSTYPQASRADYYDGQYVRNLSTYNGDEVALYAVWTPNASYVVRLHRNKGGADTATAGRKLTVGVGRYLPTISELGWSKPGYDFLGWSSYRSSDWAEYADGDYVYDLSDVDGDEVHLYAVWMAKASYTVQLFRNNSYNDGASASRRMIIGEYGQLPTVSALGWTRAGYTFSGWNTYSWASWASYGDGASVYNLSSEDGGLFSLYGVWQKNATYTVRLHRNNSAMDSSSATRSCTVGLARSLPTISELGWSRPGYTFMGWGTYQTDTTKDYSDGQSIMDLADEEGAEVNLYAIWKMDAVQYTIRLHRNNSNTDSATASRACKTGTSRSLPTISELGWSRSGYVFKGWGTYASDTTTNYSDGQSVLNLSTTAGGCVDLYAIWESNGKYTVRRHRNNSVADEASAGRAMTVGVGRALPTIHELGWSRPGYSFVGWGTSSSASTAKYDDGQTVRNLSTQNGDEVHLYAIWSIDVVNYTVMMHRNNSTTDGATASRACKTGTSRNLPTISELGWTRQGYDFVGWATTANATEAKYTDGQSVINLTMAVGGTVHLYAVWRSTAVTYTLRLHRNNSAADGAVASRALTVGKSRALPTIADLGWSRTGVGFVGWGTYASDTTANYSDGQSVRNLSTSQGAVIHLYAIWR